MLKCPGVTHTYHGDPIQVYVYEDSESFSKRRDVPAFQEARAHPGSRPGVSAEDRKGLSNTVLLSQHLSAQWPSHLHENLVLFASFSLIPLRDVSPLSPGDSVSQLSLE